MLTLTDADLTDNDIDPENVPLTVMGFTQPMPEDASLSGNGAGTLTFEPGEDVNGFFTFEYTVSDGSGGTDTATVDVTVNSVNDAPEVDGIRFVDILEDSSLIFAPGNFAFNDPRDGNAFLNVIINTLPGPTDSLTLDGTPVTAGQVVAVTDIAAGLLVYTPNPNQTSNSIFFTYQVQDDGGTDFGGVDIDPTPNGFDIDVFAVNDAPQGTDNTVTINEDTTRSFTGSDFGFSDPTPFENNGFASVVLTTLPSNGTLALGGNPVNPGQSVGVSSLVGLVYTPGENENGTGNDSFTFQVVDTGGTFGGGINTDPTPNTFTFDINAVNDAPDGTDATITLLEDGSHTFAGTDFGFTDPDDDPFDAGANALASVTIETIPGQGALELDGVAVMVGDVIAVADIPDLVYTPPAEANGAGLATFNFSVQDDGGTAMGGVDLDPTVNVITLDVTAVNDEPAGEDNTITIDEDTPHTFTEDDFGFTDPIDMNAFANVIITTLPAAGTLELSGGAVTALQAIAVADIPNLVFMPALNANGDGADSFTFQVQDDGGTLVMGDQDTDPVCQYDYIRYHGGG